MRQPHERRLGLRPVPEVQRQRHQRPQVRVVRLKRALSDLQQDEKSTWDRIKNLPEKDQALEWRKLSSQRDHVLYLAACLGDFTTPVGAPLLCEMAQSERSPDVKGWTLRRRRAVWALAVVPEEPGREGDGSFV